MPIPDATERDVLIIGAGAAGGAMAWSLARRKVDVVCLEQGDWVDPAIRPKNHVDWEVRARRYWSPSPNIRQWPADYPIASYGDDPVSVFLYNAVGGSTIGYAGNFWRFTPSDFRVRSLDGVGVDWPLAYEDLAPYYAINDREMGVAGLAGDPWTPPREPFPLPPAPLGPQGRLMIDACDHLGWEWWPTEQAIATRPYDGRPACDFKGFCPFGCPQGALATADVTYWRKALRSARNGVDLRTNARVREITLHPDGRAKGALYYDADGRLREVRAKVVVLAGGGIGTPRLLLHSASSQHPDGLANASGPVGKTLMVHVQTFVIGRFDDPVQAWQGTWGGSASTRQFSEIDPANDDLRGLVMSINPGRSPLNHALWGDGHHAAMDWHRNDELVLLCCGKDRREPTNRVALGWDHPDAFGMPGTRTVYASDATSKALGAGMIRHGTELIVAAGAASIRNYSRRATLCQIGHPAPRAERRTPPSATMPAPGVGDRAGASRMGDGPTGARADPDQTARLRAAVMETGLGPLAAERVVLPHTGRAYAIVRPTDTDLLLDRVAADPEQNLPYWAEIWPSGVALGDAIAGRPDLLRGVRVLELGAGLGVTATAALAAGADLTVTDYAPESLLLCCLNTLVNAGRVPTTLQTNWRRPDAALLAATGAGFSVVLAADVLYEGRDVAPLLALVDRLVAPGGLLWLAEPGREVAARFLTAAGAAGWQGPSETHPGPWPDPKDAGVVVGLHAMRRAATP